MMADDAASRWPMTVSSSSPRKTADPEPEGVYARRTGIKKQEILDSALVAFSQKGFHKPTLADVASAAGITAAGLLHIEQAAADGDLDAQVDPLPTASAVIAVMDGIRIQWLYDPDAVDMAEITCRVISALVRPTVPLVPHRPAQPSPA